MPADLTTLQGRLDALKQAIANGKQQVSYAGRSTTYRTIAELKDAVKTVESDIAALTGTKVTRSHRFYTCKGL